GTRADSVPPAGPSCRRAATRPPPEPRRAGTAALPREQAGPPAPRQDSAALAAATSACALPTSAVRYRSCSPGPGTREELRRQAYPHGTRIYLSHPSHRLARRHRTRVLCIGHLADVHPVPDPAQPPAV